MRERDDGFTLRRGLFRCKALFVRKDGQLEPWVVCTIEVIKQTPYGTDELRGEEWLTKLLTGEDFLSVGNWANRYGSKLVVIKKENGGVRELNHTGLENHRIICLVVEDSIIYSKGIFSEGVGFWNYGHKESLPYKEIQWEKEDPKEEEVEELTFSLDNWGATYWKNQFISELEDLLEARSPNDITQWRAIPWNGITP